MIQKNRFQRRVIGKRVVLLCSFLAFLSNIVEMENVYGQTFPHYADSFDDRHGEAELLVSVKGIEQFKSVSHPESIRTIVLRGTKITDADTIKLSRFCNVEELDLSSTRVTRKTLQLLQSLKRLHTLNLAGCSLVNDSDMKIIARLPSLRQFYLAKTLVTDSGLAKLADSRLCELSIADSLITRRALRAFRKFSSLRELNLKWCKNLRDVDMSDLAAIPGLTKVNLSGCHISASGFIRLSASKNLKTLVVHGVVIDPAVHRTVLDKASYAAISNIQSIEVLDIPLCQ